MATIMKTRKQKALAQQHIRLAASAISAVVVVKTVRKNNNKHAKPFAQES